MKNRDLGTPTVMVTYGTATKDQVLENRRNLEKVLSEIASRREGFPIKATVLWDEGKPEWYGKTRICHGDDVVFPDEVPFEDLPDWAREILLNRKFATR